MARRVNIDATHHLQVRFPLWMKLGLLFGGLTSGVIGIDGLLDLRHLNSEQAALREQSMKDLSLAVTLGLDGSTLQEFQEDNDRFTPLFQTMVRSLRVVDLTSDAVDTISTSRPDVMGQWTVVVDASEDHPQPLGFPIFDGLIEREEAWRGNVVYKEDHQDEWGTWHVVYAPIRTESGAIIGVLQMAQDAKRRDLLYSQQWRLILFRLLLGGFIALLIAFVFGRLISQHLERLVVASRRVAEGDYKTRVKIETSDEIGVLAHTFNLMVEGLEEREFIRDTFGRFVDKDVVAEVLSNPDAMSLGGESRVVSVLMSDLRGFTAMSDELGPERMVALLNRYLARMVRVVSDFDGNVSELLGDGMVVLFGAPVKRSDDARRALACSVAMCTELTRFNEEEGTSFQMGIGVHTGRVIAGKIGSDQHMKYGVVGEAINIAARLESFTIGDQVLASQATLAAAGELRAGPEVRFRAKGLAKPVVCRSVLEVDGLRMPQKVEVPPIQYEGHGEIFRILGKEVSEAGEPVQVVELAMHHVVVTGPNEVEVREKWKIELVDPECSNMYGTVAKIADGHIWIHLTSLPSSARRNLDSLLGEEKSVPSMLPPLHLEESN